MNKLQRVSLATFTAAALLTAALQTTEANAAPVPLDSIVAVVNDSIITQKQVATQMSLARMELQQEGQSVPSNAVLRQKVLDHLIGKELEREFAKNHQITVDPKSVEQTIANIAKQNGTRVATLEAAVQKQGMSIAEYKKAIADQILTQIILSKIPGYAVTANESEVNTTLAKMKKQFQASQQSYHLQGLFIPYSTNLTDASKLATQEVAMSAMKALEAGQLFTTIAAQQSATIPISAQDMGWKSLDSLPPSLAQQLATAKTNDVIGPVNSPNGIYLFKVAAIKTVTAPMPPESQLLQQARGIVLQQKMAEQEKTFVTHLKQEAYIKINK